MKYLRTVTVNGLLMALCLMVGAIIGPRLFPAAARAEGSSQYPSVIKAHRFEIIDNTGKMTGYIDAKPDGSCMRLDSIMAMKDVTTSTVWMMSPGDDNPTINFIGKESSLRFLDPDENIRLQLGYNETVKKSNPEESTAYALSTIVGYKKDGSVAWIEKE